MQDCCEYHKTYAEGGTVVMSSRYCIQPIYSEVLGVVYARLMQADGNLAVHVGRLRTRTKYKPH